MARRKLNRRFEHIEVRTRHGRDLIVAREPDGQPNLLDAEFLILTEDIDEADKGRAMICSICDGSALCTLLPLFVYYRQCNPNEMSSSFSLYHAFDSIASDTPTSFKFWTRIHMLRRWPSSKAKRLTTRVYP